MRLVAFIVFNFCFFSACRDVAPLECSLGSEDCACAAGGECEQGLECLNNACVSTASTTDTTTQQGNTEDSVDNGSTNSTDSTIISTDSTANSTDTENNTIPSGLGKSCADDHNLCSDFEADFCSVNPLEPDDAYCTTTNCFAGDCTNGYVCCNCDKSSVLPHVSACLTDDDANLAGTIGECDCTDSAEPHFTGQGAPCAKDPEVCSSFEASFCSVNPLEPDNAYCTTSPCYAGSCEVGYRCCNCINSDVLPQVSACLSSSDAELAGGIGGCNCSDTAKPHTTGLGESCASDPGYCSHFEASYCIENPLDPELAYCTTSPCSFGGCEDGYRCCNCENSPVLPSISACLLDSDAQMARALASCICD